MIGTDILKALKRSRDSRSCIDAKVRAGQTRSQARKECRQVYGSRLGNAGRSLGLVGEQAKPIYVDLSSEKKRYLKNTPSKLGTINEQIVIGSPNGTKTKESGFNIWYLLPLLLFFPAIRKMIK